MSHDYIKSSIEFFAKILKLYKCFSEESGNKFAESFNTRARSGPQLIKDIGLIPYITFLASKAGENLCVKAFEALRLSDDICKGVDEDVLKNPNKMGYAAYTIAILDYLAKLNVIKLDKYETLNVIKSLSDGLMKYRAVEPLVMKYLNELKKLSSAYFRKEE